ncbi:MAG: hypothetical protein RL336_237 [Pseudomonadota bacterium]
MSLFIGEVYHSGRHNEVYRVICSHTVFHGLLAGGVVADSKQKQEGLWGRR